ncbi:MAG TPA: hypothetical protein PKM51_08885 [Chitinophagales bacterium]|nr:hypothetical protein [Chitinophagales bacterium]HNM32856.1 hypothetical protein [Chitinophagales bacterium]
MKTSSKILFFAMTMLFLQPLVNAQTPASKPSVTIPAKTPKAPKMSAEQRAKALTDTLSNVVALSKEQYDKAYQLNLTFLTKREALKQSKAAGATPEDLKAQKKALFEDRKLQLKSLLTPEQAKKWSAWKVAKKQNKSSNSKFTKPAANSATDDDTEGM